MKKNDKKQIIAGAAICAWLLLAMAGSAYAQSSVITAGVSREDAVSEPAAQPFDVNRFRLPDGAGLLVIVEGTEGSSCNVYAYAKEAGSWVEKVHTYGYLGANGMSNHRTEGDKTTPIGLFQMNTPFGQCDPLEGFPANYIKVKESHVWTEDTNTLVDDPAAYGEHVGTFWYEEYYDYAIDAGYNKNAVAQKGSALFLHCIGRGKTDTSGCVAIPREQMIAIMRLYGTYGDGACYIAQAPRGTFGLVYESYGVNNGLSPDGDFGPF